MTHTYIRKLRKHGDDFAVTIPDVEAKRLGLKLGDPVLVKVEIRNSKPKLHVTVTPLPK
jgi:antitoxin component of MazEF toxin-antitoxin module